MIEDLVFCHFSRIFLLKYVVSYLDDLVAVVDMAANKIVQIWFQASDNFTRSDPYLAHYSFCIYIIYRYKFIPLVLRIFDSTQNYDSSLGIIYPKVEDFCHWISVDINLGLFEAAEKDL